MTPLSQQVKQHLTQLADEVRDRFNVPHGSISVEHRSIHLLKQFLDELKRQEIIS